METLQPIVRDAAGCCLRPRGGGCAASAPAASADPAQVRRYKAIRAAAAKDFRKYGSGDTQMLMEHQSLWDLLTAQAVDQPAPVRLLKGSWLEARAERLGNAVSEEEKRALALPRRQELEAADPSAFLSVEEVKALPQYLTHHSFASLCGYPLRIVCASYIWEGSEHPDPLGVQLCRMMDAIRREKNEATKTGGCGPFPDGEYACFIVRAHPGSSHPDPTLPRYPRCSALHI